jgi:hypothetical protein
MTSGLLGGLSRSKFGKYVPVLSLEAGASSGTRMRAGVEANALIPQRLRNVIEGAYVEGFVGVHAVDQHQHALCLLDDGATLGDRPKRFGDSSFVAAWLAGRRVVVHLHSGQRGVVGSIQLRGPAEVGSVYPLFGAGMPADRFY